jgi:hypothetical protein
VTVAILTALLAGSCSPWEPDRVEILVATAPPGASCVLTRAGQPIATADPTPAIAMIEPGSGEIAVHCRRRGFADAAAVLPGQGYQRRADIVLQPLGPQPLMPQPR